MPLNVTPEVTLKKSLFFNVKQYDTFVANTIRQLPADLFYHATLANKNKTAKTPFLLQEIFDRIRALLPLLTISSQQKLNQLFNDPQTHHKFTHYIKKLYVYNARAHSLIETINKQTYPTDLVFYDQQFLTESDPTHATKALEQECITPLLALALEKFNDEHVNINVKNAIKTGTITLFSQIEQLHHSINQLLLENIDSQPKQDKSGNISLYSQEQAEQYPTTSLLATLLSPNTPITLIRTKQGVEIHSALMTHALIDELLFNIQQSDLPITATVNKQDESANVIQPCTIEFTYQENKDKTILTSIIDEFIIDKCANYLTLNSDFKRYPSVKVTLEQLPTLSVINNELELIHQQNNIAQFQGVLQYNANTPLWIKRPNRTPTQTTLRQLYQQTPLGSSHCILETTHQYTLILPHCLIKGLENSASQQCYTGGIVIQQIGASTFIASRSITQKEIALLNIKPLPIPGKLQREKLTQNYFKKFTTEKGTMRKTLINEKITKKDILPLLPDFSANNEYTWAKKALTALLAPMGDVNNCKPQFYLSLNFQKTRNTQQCYGIDLTIYGLKNDEIVVRHIASLINEIDQKPVQLGSDDQLYYGFSQNTLQTQGQSLECIEHKITRYLKNYIPNAIVQINHQQSHTNTLMQFPQLKKQLECYISFDAQRVRQEERLTAKSPLVSALKLDAQGKHVIYFSDSYSGQKGLTTQLKKEQPFSLPSLDGQHKISLQQDNILRLTHIADQQTSVLPFSAQELAKKTEIEMKPQNTTALTRTHLNMVHCHTVNQLLDDIAINSPSLVRQLILSNENYLPAIPLELFTKYQEGYQFSLSPQENITRFAYAYSIDLNQVKKVFSVEEYLRCQSTHPDIIVAFEINQHKAIVDTPTNDIPITLSDFLLKDTLYFLKKNTALQDHYSNAYLYHCVLDKIEPNTKTKPLDELKHLSTLLGCSFDVINEIYEQVYNHQILTTPHPFLMDQKTQSPFTIPFLVYDMAQLSQFAKQQHNRYASEIQTNKTLAHGLDHYLIQHTLTQFINTYKTLSINDKQVIPNKTLSEHKLTLINDPKQTLISTHDVTKNIAPFIDSVIFSTLLTNRLPSYLNEKNSTIPLEKRQLITKNILSLAEKAISPLANNSLPLGINLSISQHNIWWSAFSKRLIELLTENNTRKTTVPLNRDIQPKHLQDFLPVLSKKLTQLRQTGQLNLTTEHTKIVWKKIKNIITQAIKEYSLSKKIRAVHFDHAINTQTTPLLQQKEMAYASVTHPTTILSDTHIKQLVFKELSPDEKQYCSTKRFKHEIKTVFQTSPLLMGYLPELATSLNAYKQHITKSTLTKQELSPLMLSQLQHKITLETLIKYANKTVDNIPPKKTKLDM